MSKHKLIKLKKIIEERIGSISEEVEVATNTKLNPLYIVDRKDEIESLRWTTRIIRWILDRADRRRPAAWSNQNEIGVRRYDKIRVLK